MTKRVWLAIAAPLLLAAGGGVWWWSERPPPPIVWQGYAEADFVKVGPTQQGLLTAVRVARGDEVAVGAPLFTQDDADDRAARDQAVQMLAQAARQLVNLRTVASRPKSRRPRPIWRTPRRPWCASTADLDRGEALLPNGRRYEAKRRSAAGRPPVGSGQGRRHCRRRWRSRGRRWGGWMRSAAARGGGGVAGRAGHGRVAARATPRRRAGGGRVADVLARPGETMAAGAAGGVAAAAREYLRPLLRSGSGSLRRCISAIRSRLPATAARRI